MSFVNKFAPLALALVIALAVSVFFIASWYAALLWFLFLPMWPTVGHTGMGGVFFLIFWGGLLATGFVIWNCCWNILNQQAESKVGFRNSRWTYAALTGVGTAMLLVCLFGHTFLSISSSPVTWPYAPSGWDVLRMLLCLGVNFVFLVYVSWAKQNTVKMPVRPGPAGTGVH